MEIAVLISKSLHLFTKISFSSIDSMTGHIDIMGEMYSEFLKYALGDGTELELY